MGELIAYFDGACRNDGTGATPMGLGVALFYQNGAEKPILIAERAVYTASLGTNHIAEAKAQLLAIRTALRWLRVRSFPTAIERVVVRGDNQAVINQYNGDFTINSARLAEIIRKSQYTAQNSSPAVPFVMEWIGREGNQIADKLSKQALQSYIEEVGHIYQNKN